MTDKPSFTPTEPDSFDINISDRKGYKTLLTSLIEIGILIFIVIVVLKTLIYFSPILVSQNLENRIFKNAHKSVFSNTRLSKNLTDLGKKLDPTNSNLEVFIFPSKTSNAFCFLGNKIFITSKLLKEAESENELSFVLAHELGHAHHRHNLKNISLNFVIKLLFNSIGFLNSSLDALSLGYSRGMEAEADDFALNAVKKYYGHTFGAETFFTRMENKNSNKTKKIIDFVSSYLSTHPNTKERVQKILKSQEVSEIESDKITNKLTNKLIDKKQNY